MGPDDRTKCASIQSGIMGLHTPLQCDDVRRQRLSRQEIAITQTTLFHCDTLLDFYQKVIGFTLDNFSLMFFAFCGQNAAVGKSEACAK
jgi:hypothetical protein